MCTWGQLGIHNKPVVLLNTCGFYDHLIAQLDCLVAEGFLSPAMRQVLTVASTPAEVLQLVQDAVPPEGVLSWGEHTV